MRFQMDQDWRSYVRHGDETSAELLKINPPALAAFDDFDRFFRERLWVGDVDLSPQEGFLSMHSYMMLLSGLRMTLTGHAAATFPLYRAALEAACYAYLMSTDKTYEGVWVARNKSPAAAKKCRAKFTSAVSDTARAINTTQPGSGDLIVDIYQAAIDFGAHPNPRSIFLHMQEPEDTGQFWKVSLTGLHASNGFEVTRSLVASLDFGLAIAIVLFRALKDPSQEVADALNELNELKERMVADLNAASVSSGKAPKCDGR